MAGNDLKWIFYVVLFSSTKCFVSKTFVFNFIDWQTAWYLALKVCLVSGSHWRVWKCLPSGAGVMLNEDSINDLVTSKSDQRASFINQYLTHLVTAVIYKISWKTGP